MKTKRNRRIGGWMLQALFVALVLGACNDPLEDSVYRTSDVLMIDEYMEKDQLTDFLAIIDKADYRGMLHAYGTYTCFIPTNEAVQKHMKEIGKTIDALSKEEAMTIVGYHVVNDTLSTRDFVDGRLSTPNILKQYITTRTMANENNNVYIEVDRKAKIVKKDIVLGNGYIHLIDAMLGKAEVTLAGKVRALPSRFSFLKDLFEEAGAYNLLSNEISPNAEESAYSTVFMQDNQSFIDLGIDTRDKLLDRLRANSPEVNNDKELIKNFVLYHIIVGRKYITDLMTASALSTFVPQQVLSFSMTKDILLINEYKIGKLDEEGVPLNRESEYSDVSCANGVVHEVMGILEIKKRPAYRVNFDLGEQPEMKALKTYRKVGAKAVYTSDDLSEMSWGGKSNPTVTYACDGTTYSEKGQYVYGDYLMFRVCTNVMQWCELKLPLLVEGTYKVWLCYRRNNPMTFRTTFMQEGEENQILPTVVDMSGYMPIYYTDATKTLLDYDKMEQEGWKQYTARKENSVMNSRLMGTIKVSSTGRHTLRMDALSASKGTGGNWDMIQFIPIDDDQIWPMIDMLGTSIEKGTPLENIWPY